MPKRCPACTRTATRATRTGSTAPAVASSGRRRPTSPTPSRTPEPAMTTTTERRPQAMPQRELVRSGGTVWVPFWVLAVLVVAGLLRRGAESGAIGWAWALAVGAGLFGAFGAVLISVIGDRDKAAAHRAAASVMGGVWTAYIATVGWPWTSVILLAGGAALVGLFERWLAPTEWVIRGIPQPLVEQVPAASTSREAWWAEVLRRTFKQQVPVLRVVPWNVPEDGEEVVVEIPDGLTFDSFIGACSTIATRAQLEQGCTVQTKPGAHQGVIVLNVMLRNCLAEYRRAEEDITPSSINEGIPLARLPQGGHVMAYLREKSMLVGGMTGSGKTTFLHRLIMRMARWVDALIWVIDLNGGGTAWPWVEAYAKGLATKPIVDWVADNEFEAAVMVAITQAVAKDRKISPEARRRRKAKNTTVLPVDKDLPAIILITDEGAEIAQATTLIGQLVKMGITRTAQIARAEGVRVVMSILRGTSDLLDRALKTAMAVMVCLRMALHEEYGHVLGVDPRYKGPMPNGDMFVNFPESGEGPVKTKTEDVTPDMIEAHSIATAHLRPDLDERAQKVAARVTVRDVLGGKDPRDFPDIARHPVMRDVEAGRAYAGRWDRAARQLAELRGEDVPEFDDEPVRVHVPDRPTAAEPGSLVEKFLLDAKAFRRSREPEVVPAGAAVPAQREREVGPADVFASRPRPAGPSTDLVPVATGDGVQTTVRELIRMVVRQAGTEWLTDAEIRRRIAAETRVDVNRSRSGQVLAAMVRAGEVERDDTSTSGPYYRQVVR
ncbi:hypothetical protein OOJ91_12435 [Micromonospora lupini]|uniref:hypothetical protein n=1 Tax=Micromonospora lupini TaxID=285679 RepID=UPI0022542D25|nr:hypothetical protein [Micromonospora lupini]MCX5066687.1 hypothetical protein [Micromonospora lupini]